MGCIMGDVGFRVLEFDSYYRLWAPSYTRYKAAHSTVELSLLVVIFTSGTHVV